MQKYFLERVDKVFFCVNFNKTIIGFFIVLKQRGNVLMSYVCKRINQGTFSVVLFFLSFF